MIGLNHSPYLSQYKITIVAEELLFKNHRLLNLNVQNSKKRSPKEHHVTLSLGISVPLSLLENQPIASLVKDDHYELSGNINGERTLPDYFLYGGGPLS